MEEFHVPHTLEMDLDNQKKIWSSAVDASDQNQLFDLKARMVPIIQVATDFFHYDSSSKSRMKNVFADYLQPPPEAWSEKAAFPSPGFSRGDYGQFSLLNIKIILFFERISTENLL